MNDRIQLAHGGGGELTAELIRDVILPALGGPQEATRLSDAAGVSVAGGRVMMTTDSYVVQPLEFPGGDIGKLAVCGTVNDLAVAGSRPLALSIGLVCQEGLELSLLQRVLESAGRAAERAGVAIVTGDTKVVGRDALDGLVINTAGVGEPLADAELGYDNVRPGDAVILSGPPGEHGLAVMGARENLALSAELSSDCAPLNDLTAALVVKLGGAVRWMRDPTRGGLAATLVELSEGTGLPVEIDETAIPVNRTARSAAEILGLDLLTVANEGKLVAVVAPDAVDEAVAALHEFEIAAEAATIGRVGERSELGPIVEMFTSIGGRRIVQMPYGEELPRIC